MEFEFPWPVTQGEWLAWSSAAATVAFGIILLFAPRLSFRLLRLQTTPEHPEAVAEGRATMSGFYLGVGLSAFFWRSRCFIWRSAFPGFSRLSAASSPCFPTAGTRSTTGSGLPST